MTQDDMHLKESDSASVRTQVRFDNLTSRSSRVASGQVAVLELGDAEIVLEVPKTSCNVNHSVSVEVEREDRSLEKSSFTLRITGKVAGVDSTDDPTMIRVRIKMLQYDEEAWKKFVALNEDKQSRVDQYVRAVKGW